MSESVICRNSKQRRDLSNVPVEFLNDISYVAWGSVVAKALRYKSVGPGIDSKW